MQLSFTQEAIRAMRRRMAHRWSIARAALRAARATHDYAAAAAARTEVRAVEAEYRALRTGV